MKDSINLDILKRSSPARPSRRFLSFVIDSFIVIIISMLVFSGIFKITENTNLYKNQETIVNNEISYYEEFAKSTHLVEFIDGQRADEDVVAFKNLNRAICLSYEIFGNSQQPNFKFDMSHEVTKCGVASLENDNISYFYTMYLPENDPNGQIINMYEINPVDYLFEVYKNAFDTDASFMFTFNKEISNVPVLNTQVAYYLFHYLYINQSDVIGETGETYYNAYINAYSYMLKEAENKLLVSEPYYSTHYVLYVDAYCKQAKYTNISLVFSILIAYFLGVLLPKYLFKNEKTLGYKILGLGVISLDNEENKWYVSLIKSLFDAIGFITCALILYLFPPFNGVFDAMFLPITSSYKISFGLIILVIGIISTLINVVMLFTHYNQNLLNILFKDKVVDIHYLDEGDNDEKFEGRSY